MDSRDAIRQSIALADFIAGKYLEDLDESDLFIRPAEGVNHIAWQLGHLISAEHRLMSAIRPGAMPALPEGFTDKYSNETASSDDPAQFHTKEEYLGLLRQQREGTLNVLSGLSDEELDAPAPEMLRERFPTIGTLMALQAIHTTMHSGQWAVVRRMRGKPVVI